MDKMTLNYGRLHTLELKKCHQIYCRSQNLFRAQKVSSSMTDDMVSRAQEGV